jgi:nitroimidazol reductase NimA-like FMN-containing flavoprotein (pyridoxamine 5'-phosphate oxidase superfamily)
MQLCALAIKISSSLVDEGCEKGEYAPSNHHQELLTMRRSDREITDRKTMEEIIRSARVCRLGLIDGDLPYIVPLNFGYRNGTFYFHSARAGKKIELLARGRKVCIEIDEGHELVSAEAACNWGMRYVSVIAYGLPRFIEEPTAKREALAIIMAQYTDGAYEFPESAISATAVFAVDADILTGKQKV